MKTKIDFSKTLLKVKDWLTITRIRLTNFAKEHKYVSSIVGLFLLSGLVSVIVFAETDEYAGKVSTKASVKVMNLSGNEVQSEIESFDTLVFSVDYSLFIPDETIAESVVREKVIIEASVNESLDAEWYQADETVNYDFDNNNKTMTVTTYNILVGENNSHNQKLYLKVNNVKNGTPVDVTIKIKEATANEFASVEIGSVNVKSKEVPLTAKIISGKAYKNDDFKSGRYAPYGIIVGFDESTLNNGSLKGLYFNPDLTLTMEATQIVNGIESQIELETKENYFGLYDRDKNLIDAPNYIYDPSQISVFDSGKILSFDKSSAGVSSSNNEVISQDLYLVGEKSVDVLVNTNYEEQGVKLSDTSSEICKVTSGNCTRVITNSSGKEVTQSDMQKTVGAYKVTYIYKTQNSSTTVFRTVNVVENNVGTDEVTLDGNTYSLIGNKNVTVIKESSYNDLGISKNGIATPFTGDNDVDLTTNVFLNSELVSKVDTSTIGKYTIKYSITSRTTSDAKLLERTVTVVEPSAPLKSATVKANTITIMASNTFETPNIEIDGNNVKCTSENGCSVKYYDPATGSETNVDSSKAGTYKAVYTVTDKNGFIITVENTINIQIKYDLKISGIKTDGSYYKHGSFLAFGSYFVNAKSFRDTSITDDIPVYLKIGSETSSPITNYNHSIGTKEYELSFDSAGEETLETQDGIGLLAYGEDVILKSKFTYSSDGDDNIKTLKVKIPVNESTSTANPSAPFDMVEYSSDAEAVSPYYINSEFEESISVKYYGCDMDEAATKCSGNPTVYDNYEAFNDAKDKNSKLKLAYVEYTLTNVKPGSKVDFRLRLKTSVGNQSGTVTLSSVANYDETKVSKDSKVKITAFKARTKVSVSDSDQDIMIDGSNTSITTWSILPSVLLPAQNINTNVSGISDLKLVTIVVNLPAGINYVYNDDYDKPTISADKKTLTYKITGKKVNDWFDPIYFDTSYDIDIKSGTELSVDVIIDAEASNGVKDISNVALRTVTRKVMYNNLQEIPFGMYVPYSAVSKNTPIDVTTKIYNNDANTYSNLDVVMLLPYNDASSEKTYTGSYKLNITEDTLCTITPATTIMNNSNDPISSSEITWDSCDKYASNEYVGVTAIRVSGLSLNPGAMDVRTVKIIPIGNKTGDVYKINSYLYSNDGTKIEKKSSKNVEVEVISKKITGVAWEDFDGNGIMDSEEKKVAGVTFKLYESGTNKYVTETISDEKGKYTLADLVPGKYYIVAEYNAAKYGLSPSNVTNDKTVNSSFVSDADQNDVITPELPDESEGEDEVCTGDDCKENTPTEKMPVIKTEEIEITNNTKTISNINLGLALRKVYAVKMNKYVSKVITTNKLGVSTIKDFGNVNLAKLDVKDLSNLSIKVIYTIELENVGYYPGYIYAVKDYIPDGMSFNEEYEENKGWTLNENGYLENGTLFDQLVYGGEKKHLTIAFDVTRKEAGSFINYASVDDEDLHILAVAGDQENGGNENE